MSYSGRATKSGNSQAMAFEKALFRAHPEFAEGRLAADYIGPGYLLVRALPGAEQEAPEADPVLGAYLAFLERDMQARPERIQALPSDLIARAQELVGHLEVDPDEDLGDDVSID
ncbi:MAG: type II toxin-antitoxin system PrlF family antitoxin [Gemmatimonadota bacterium]